MDKSLDLMASIMQPLIAGRFIDKYLIYSQVSAVCNIITEQQFFNMVHLSNKPDSLTPNWLEHIFAKMGYNNNIPDMFNDAILIRNSDMNFGRASFEITEKCNFNCHHCFLGKKMTRSMSAYDKCKIIQIIERSGCLWLQITGGEPLLSMDFIPIYTYAYSLGLLVTLSTNGSLLNNSKIIDTFLKYPPFRITVSLYGATKDSFERLTQIKGSFQDFMKGIERVKEIGTRVRVNIIITRFNSQELDKMINIAKKNGFEYQVYSKLAPTLDGNPSPLQFMGTRQWDFIIEDILSEENVTNSKCQAGKKFYHVNASGKASICQMAREPSVDLLQEGINGLKMLEKISNQLLEPPLVCRSCEIRDNCKTCSPLLNLYRKSKIVPKYICYKQDFKEEL